MPATLPVTLPPIGRQEQAREQDGLVDPTPTESPEPGAELRAYERQFV
jgi:hypothetical protein